MTIMDAVLQVMRRTARPMRPYEVFAEIEEGRLYDFRARDPAGVVRTQMRRHSLECPAQSAATVLYLKSAGKDSYELLPAPVKRQLTRATP